VCKDKEVTRDAENNRWVCKASKAVVSRPGINRAPVGDIVKDADVKPKSGRETHADSKTAKAKKN
jgi:transcription initiation factor TFIIIB Brf1 subunit/transcription initiation factor TFIIB